MPGDASADRRAPDAVPRSAEVNTHVGALLRTMHESVLNEAVPDRFLELLRQIDHKGEDAAPALAEQR